MVVSFDSIDLMGKLEASAVLRQLDQPSEGKVRPGGSGGYIFVKTSENSGENKVDGTIEAFGGNGLGGGFGGAGGVVVFDANLPAEKITVRGGRY